MGFFFWGGGNKEERIKTFGESLLEKRGKEGIITKRRRRRRRVFGTRRGGGWRIFKDIFSCMRGRQEKGKRWKLEIRRGRIRDSSNTGPLYVRTPDVPSPVPTAGEEGAITVNGAQEEEKRWRFQRGGIQRRKQVLMVSQTWSKIPGRIFLSFAALVRLFRRGKCAK